MKKTIALIPARGGSRRLPNKNILMLGRYPLLAHSILYAQQNTDIIDEIYVSTNNEAIKKVALEFGAKVINRPDSISGDFEPTLSTLQHAIAFLGNEVENVVLLQPTNPLRPKNLLRECFEVFQQKSSDSLFTVTPSLHKFGKIKDECFIPYNYEIGQRSQDMEPLYFENGLLYITKAKSISEGRIITENAFPFIINDTYAQVDIDTKEDFDYAAYLLNNLTHQN